MSNDYISIHSSEFKDKMKKFLEIYKENPEVYPEFSTFTITPYQLEGYPDNMDGILRKKAELYLGETERVHLGDAVESYDLDSGCNIRGCWCKKRRNVGECWAIFTHPSIEDVRSDVKECALIAAVTATLAAIWASPSAALPAFKGAFVLCLKSKAIEWADEIDVDLETKWERGRWRPCETF